MPVVLPAQLPWFVVGPLIGLLVAGFYALANRPIGVSGAYVQVMGSLRGRRVERWRIWYFAGIFAGGLFAALLRGGPALTLEYGALGASVPLALLVPLLFVAGLIMGYGAGLAGGCTSGHGLCGIAVLSPASLAATASFMATAVIVTGTLHFVSGGRL